MNRLEQKLGWQAGGRDLSRLAWLPVAALAVAMIIVWRLDLRGSHESHSLVTAMNFVFLSLVSVLIAYVAGRGFALTGKPGLLWFGSGILVWGATGGIAGAAVAKSVDAAVTIHNTGLLISAACNLIGALLTVTDRKPISKPGLALVFAATGVACAVGLLTIAAFAGRLPLFFIQGHGGTLLRFGVLGGAAGLYLASASIMLVQSRRPLSRFLFWYSAGLVLLTCGVLGIMFEPVVGGVLSWVGRSAQYLGGAYLAAAAIISGAEARVWGVNVEEELRKSEGRERDRAGELAALLDAVPTPVFISHDPESRHITGNRAADRLLRNPRGGEASLGAPEDARPHHFRAFKDGRELAVEELPSQRAARGERVEGMELSLVFDDGTVREVIGYARPLQDADGQPGGSILALADITELKKAEEALNDTKTKFEMLLQQAPVGFAYLDRDLRFLQVNERLAEMNGVPARAHLGKAIAEIVPAILPAVVEVTARILATGEPVVGHEFTGETAAQPGVMRSWIENWYPLRDAGGEIIGFGALVVEITERKRAEKSLEESRAKYRNLIETTSDFIWEVDASGKYTYCSPQMEKMWGIKPEEMIGKTPFDQMPPEARREGIKLFLGAVESKSPFSGVQVPSLDGRGNLIMIEISGVPFFDANGELSGFRGVTRDITERKQAEEILRRDKETFEQLVKERTVQLLEAHAELDRARRLSDIGVLAATVAHELRNPLAAISMAVHNIKRKAGNPDLDRHLTNIDTKISESDQIIGNLLFYSRLKPPEFEDVKILDVLEESIESVDHKNKGKISVVRDLDSLRNVSIEADPFQMKELFVNVLNNAYDAAPENDGELRIASRVEDEHVTMSFEDNGPGIPKDIMDKVFDPFFTTKTKGVGLGLSVCRQIASMHGGEIGIRDDFTRGTSVVVRLPKRRRNLGLEWLRGFES